MSDTIGMHMGNYPEKIMEFNKQLCSNCSETANINLHFFEEAEWYKPQDIALLFFRNYTGKVINKKLEELGYQYSVEIKGKLHWIPTEKGIPYIKCYTLKYNTATNSVVSYRIKWHKSIIPILRKAFFNNHVRSEEQC